jgi:hypothetical protein
MNEYQAYVATSTTHDGDTAECIIWFTDKTPQEQKIKRAALQLKEFMGELYREDTFSLARTD